MLTTMAGPSNESIVEERREMMVSPSLGSQIHRIGHFLRPSVTSADGPVHELPSDAFSPGNEKNFRLKVKFNGWRCPPRDWKTWVDQMHSLHQSVWKQAGIYDAIMNSTYIIHRDEDLILAIAERWCPQTNTFLFPCGETTITLEDMMVLGGYSVLGKPVVSPVETVEMKETETKLLLARSEISNTTAKKACQYLWMRKFISSGSEIDHEAFLSLWLSRFVFPVSTGNSVPQYVLPMAIHLARGIKVVVAPGVLASLYTDLSKLRKALVSSMGPANNKQEGYVLEHKISAPFQLVQIWAWERLPRLQPKPNNIGPDQPRFSKWSGIRSKITGNVKLIMADVEDHFNWQPYAVDGKSFLSRKIYKEKEWQTLVAFGMDEEVELVIRCLRVSELAGIDANCIEQYLPHRVARQFSMDQDLPGHVLRANANQFAAWENYNRRIRDRRLCIPSRPLDSNVTLRYLEWWKKSLSAAEDGDTMADLPCKHAAKRIKASPYKGAFPNAASHKRFLMKKLLKSAGKELDNDELVSPGLPPKC